MSRAAATRVWEREPALATARRLVTRLRRGHGGGLFVVGEAGLGKTTVLDRVQRSAAAAGIRVAVARGDPMEESLPYGVAAQFLAELGGRDVLIGSGADVPDSERRTALFVAVLRWFEKAGTESVLLALDDLHCADPDSLALVAFLCRRLGRLRVGIVGTLRPWPAEAHQAVTSLADAGHASVQRLAPLTEDSAGYLLAACIGRPIGAETVGRAWRACGGNPLLLEQVARYLGRGEPVPEAVDQAATPQLAEKLLLGRFAGLPAEGVRCARGASVLGGQFRIEVAAAVADLGDAEAERAADALVRSGLLRPGARGMVEFAHPLFRQALYTDLTPSSRSRLHARAFAVLRERGQEAEAAEQAIRGELAGNHNAIDLLERVGRAALGAGALATAARLLEAAVELAGSNARPELLAVAGEVMLTAGGRPSTVGTLSRLAAHPAADRPTRAHALRMLSRAHWLDADFDAAARTCEAAVELTHREHPEIAVEVLLDHALVLGYVCRTAESLEQAERARRLARDAGAAASARADAVWGMTALVTGDPSGIDRMAAAVRGNSRRQVTHAAGGWGWSEVAIYATAARYVERFADAERLMAEALESAEQSDVPGMVCSTAIVQADTLLRTGRLGEALELAERATALADVEPVVEAHAWATLGAVRWATGDLAGSETCCDRAEAAARQRGQMLALLQVCDVRGRCHLSQGRLEEAHAMFLRAEEFSRFMGVGEPCVVPWAGHAITAHLRCGSDDDALRIVGWLEASTERLPCRWPRIAAARGRAMLAERRGDQAGATAHHEAALSLHSGVELTLERMLTTLEHGAFLRRSGLLLRARPLLAEAATSAERLGARGLARAALAELRAAGGRRRRQTEPERLTAQETRVAGLAVEGRTNVEIARILSLSTSTVKTHLERVYAKLEVRSRRELAAAWAGLGAPPVELVARRAKPSAATADAHGVRRH